jgi:hypothetical protein
LKRLTPELDQKIDIVDSQTACAYEFKVSGKNAWAEFYKDVVKVLMWNQHRNKKLPCLVFITEEKYGKPFLDAPMPRAYIKYLAEQGRKVSIEDVRHSWWDCALRWAAELAALSPRLPAIFLADAKSSERFWEFFAANIRNKNTRRAYYKAACRFSNWFEGRGLFDLARVRPIDVAAFIKDAGLQADTKGYLFRTVAGKTGRLTALPLSQADAYRMIRRRARDAGILTKIGNHSFRATGITAHLKNGGKLEIAQQTAHESSRTTGLYDRRDDDVSLDEVERIGI